MKLIDWHKKTIKYWQEKFGFSDYAILWITFLKGVTIGALIYHLSF